MSDDPPQLRGFEARTRRWREQRWLLDATIAAQGVDWDVPRSAIYGAPCGPEGMAEFAAAAARIRKFDDIAREYAAAAARREARAAEYEAAGRALAAAECWFIAAQLRGAARWPVLDRGPALEAADRRVRRAYARFAALAPRPVAAVEIAGLPAWLHLPRAPAPGERFPLLVQVPGMDNNKEQMVALHGDRWLGRGVAVLAIDGPGQAEAIMRGTRAGPDSHAGLGAAIADWAETQPALDPSRLALRGVSFGSYFAPRMAAGAPGRFRACVAAFVAHEPGLRTLWEAAPPSFKVRFMMMAGSDDEAAFDRFAAGFDPRLWAGALDAPLLVLAGSDDELSPVEHTEAFLRAVRAPKRLVVYEGARHVLRGGPAVLLGENPDTLAADWLLDRFAGKPFADERWLFSTAGRLSTGPLAG